MKINRLKIENFKSIEFLELKELEDFVIIVGENGVGKSSIFDAIRLFKSAYGEYSQKELNNWYNEFGVIYKGGKIEVSKILRDKSLSLKIEMEVKLSQNEIEYLIKNSYKLLESYFLKESRNSIDYESDLPTPSIIGIMDTFEKEIKPKIENSIEKFNSHLRNGKIFGYIEIDPKGEFKYSKNIALQTLFSTYKPEEIGVIDFYGSNRNFPSQEFNNIGNISINTTSENYKNNLLYNYNSKYSNVKQELARGYIKALILKEVGDSPDRLKSLNSTLSELFRIFIPNKKFEGVVPTKDGDLSFPIVLENGVRHDISSLSSGEKEIIFGYLRLYNQSFSESVILIDEPELHLNPKISRKLPEFYYSTLGKNLNNQFILVTHSDSIVKETIGKENFSLFHMSLKLNTDGNQARAISLDKELEPVILDLFGDLSTFNYGNKVVVFEGENSEFDNNLTNNLFPDFKNTVNSISAGSKTNVKNLHSVLKRASDSKIISKEFFSIIDRDSSEIVNDPNFRAFSWDVYHIENYLLSESHIYYVLRDLNSLNSNLDSEEKILIRLREAAELNMDFHLNEEFHQIIDKEIMDCLKNKRDKNKELVESYSENIKSIKGFLSKKSNGILGREGLELLKQKIHNKLVDELQNDLWKKNFKGKMILKTFISKNCSGINYEKFVSLIITKMKDEGYQPEGMKKVIEKILLA